MLNKSNLEMHILALFVVVLFITIIFLSIPAGFDIYSHSIEVAIGRDNHHIFEYLSGIKIPRYFLLSLIYSFFNNFSIGVLPVGYVLCMIPSIDIINSLISKNNNNYSLSIPLIIWSVSLYSASSISVLYLFAYYQTNKNIYLLGAFFSPLGILIIIFGSSSLLLRKSISKFNRTNLNLFMKVLFFIFYISIFISISTVVYFLLSQISLLIQRKYIELFVLIFLLIGLIVQKHIKLSLKFNYTFIFLCLLLMIGLAFLYFINFYDSNNLFSYLFLQQESIIFEIALFGGNYNYSFEQLFIMRGQL